MHLYLSGPMSDLPDNNLPAFFTAEEELKKAGHTVINPARMPEPEGVERMEKKAAWRSYMKRDIVEMIQSGCTHLVALPGWENSQGAGLEIYLAMNLGMPVLDYPDLKPLFIG